MCKVKWMRAKFRSFKAHIRHKQVENTGLNLLQALKTDILP